MSTAFRTTATDEWVCTRWASRDRGTCLDFGSEARFDRLFLSGDLDLEGEDGSATTLFQLLEGRTVTFGEFCGTVELGSGELLDRLGVEGLDSTE